MDPGLVIGPLGLVPAIFILYITLGPYETKFENKVVFLSFIGGMILGTIVLLLEGSFLLSFDFTEAIYLDIIILLSLLFAFFDQLAKLVVVNLPRFHQKTATAIYGASLGIGFGAPAGAMIFRDIELLTVEGILGVSVVLSFMFFHSATGALLGLGIAKGKKWTYFFRAFLAGALFWPLVITRTINPYLTPAIIILSLGLYIYVHRIQLPNIIHDRKTRRSLKRQRTKKKLLRKL